jgi:hypothetical protein
VRFDILIAGRVVQFTTNSPASSAFRAVAWARWQPKATTGPRKAIMAILAVR